jgi:peptide methionine sulfoxide reductase MsrB
MGLRYCMNSAALRFIAVQIIGAMDAAVAGSELKR